MGALFSKGSLDLYFLVGVGIIFLIILIFRYGMNLRDICYDIFDFDCDSSNGIDCDFGDDLDFGGDD